MRKLMITAAVIASCLTAAVPAFAFSDDFLNGIAAEWFQPSPLAVLP